MQSKMERYYFCRYSNQTEDEREPILESDPLRAVKRFCRKYPYNQSRRFPVFVNWVVDGIPYRELYTATRTGIKKAG